MVEGLIVVTFWWGEKYDVSYVNKLAAGVRRHLAQPYTFVCIDDKGFEKFSGDVHRSWPISDENLTRERGCFARLRIFSPNWQQWFNIQAGQRIVCMDLDMIVTGPLDHLFDRPESFVILQGANASNPCPYNGSLMMLRAGAHGDVWSGFSTEIVARLPYHEFPDDQGWLAHKVPNAAGWKAGPESGVYAFQKPGWPHGTALPKDARLVAFPGKRDPSQFTQLPWIVEHWRQ